MNFFSIVRGLDVQGIKRFAQYLDEEENKSLFFQNLNNIPEGKFLLSELKDRRELARNLYASVDVTHPDACILLATLQAYEREADEWIRRIEGYKTRCDELAQMKEDLRKVLEERNKQVQTSTVRFLPKGATNRKKE